jgi:copper homeostasis protein
MKKFTLEIACESPQDCANAEVGGADRIELCSALSLGGLTPSLGTLKKAKELCGLPIMAMVRPRAGGFYYSDYELDSMVYDANRLIDEGADGIVFGFLNPDFSVDLKKTLKLVELGKSSGKQVVFHRAFDLVSNPFEAAEQLIEIGVTRILTSGQEPTALEGIDTNKKLQLEYGNKIEILAGSGVRLENARQILDIAKVDQIHTTAKIPVEKEIATTSRKDDFGGGDGGDGGGSSQANKLYEVSSEIVRNISQLCGE